LLERAVAPLYIVQLSWINCIKDVTSLPPQKQKKAFQTCRKSLVEEEKTLIITAAMEMEHKYTPKLHDEAWMCYVN